MRSTVAYLVGRDMVPRPEPPRTIPTDVDRGALEVSGRVSADEFRGAVLVCKAKARDAARFD